MSSSILYEEFTNANFNAQSLDDFIRHQVVTECWRKIDGEWKLMPISFVEDWTLDKLRSEAGNIANNLNGNMVDFGAFLDGKVIGFATVGKELFGSQNQYCQLVTFQVSEPYRGKGIGKTLFEMAQNYAKQFGAKKLYISAHSSKESQAAYKALGCVHAVEINQKLFEEEPFEVHMEYIL